MKRKYMLILGIIELFVALGALPAGLMFILKPDGSLMGMNTLQLSNSPFSDFLIPGMALFTINGVLNFVNAILCFKRNKNAPIFGFVLSIALMIWVIVQVWSIGFNHFLQPVYFGIGIIVLFFSILSFNTKKLE